ncbi:unnamed protein product [Victoria cruziana]
MVHVSFYRNYGKTFKKPRRPYEKERLDAELKLVGEYGLRCKRELWRVQYALSRIRKAARELLTLDEKNERRIFEGDALLRRMNQYGLLDESQNKLDYVLALTVENFLERRLQTLVFKSGMAKSIHHARVLIRQRHIRLTTQATAFSILYFAFVLIYQGLSSIKSVQEISRTVYKTKSKYANHILEVCLYRTQNNI